MPPTNVDYAFETFFPTTVLMADYPHADRLNATLADSVYQVRDNDTHGRGLSEENYGVGYTSFYSDVNLLTYEGFLELAEFITQFGHGFAEHLDLDLSQHALGMISYWVNINPKFSFHHIHTHPDALFSGVYYVQMSDGPGGKILFKDPRPAAATTTYPLKRKTGLNSDSTTIEPVAGRLLMFPAWLPHGVDQNLGERDRISISYNIGIRPKT